MFIAAEIYLALLIFTALPVHAASGFLQPPLEGINIAPGILYTVRWMTDWGVTARILLEVFQSDGNNGWYQQRLLYNVTDPGSYNWTAKPLAGLPQGNGFHFFVANTSIVDGDGADINSGALFLRNDAATTTSTVSIKSSATRPSLLISSTFSTSATSSSLPISSTFSTSAPVASSTSSAGSNPPEPSPPKKNSSNRVAIIAGVIGAVVGIGASIIVFLALKRDRHGRRLLIRGVSSLRWKFGHDGQQRQHEKERLEDPNTWHKAELDGNAVARAELEDNTEVKELAASNPPAELLGDVLPRIVEKGANSPTAVQNN